MKRENIKITRLTKPQLQQKIDYIDFYSKNKTNASSSSIFDANANVAQKNIATLSAEIYKDFSIQINRELMHRKLNNLYGEEIADKYLSQLENHEIYSHDESALNQPYCCSISMYPFLLNGTETLGGDSKAPQHLETFCGGFINLVFLVASQFAGAVATTEFLMYFDHFARKDFGDNYLETNGTYIRDKFSQVVYTLNQPASARNFQSVFWNISIFDKPYFESLFGEFVFPDDDKPKWETLNKLQKIFMIWFNKERSKKVLTFPVISATILSDGKEPVDKDFEEMVTKELSEGNSFFVYMSTSVDSLASCCFEGNEVIEVKDINDNIHKMSVREFVEMFEINATEKTFDTGYMIESVNPDTLEKEWVKITGILKKDNNFMYLIEMEVDGNIVKVTPDHIFLVRDRQMNIKEITANHILNNPNEYEILI